jgi:hypothetical protein
VSVTNHILLQTPEAFKYSMDQLTDKFLAFYDLKSPEFPSNINLFLLLEMREK